MPCSGMRINIPSKEETITFFHVKNQLDFNVSQKGARYFSHCFPLGSSFLVIHLGFTETGQDEITYTKLAGFLLPTKLGPPRNCTTD